MGDGAATVREVVDASSGRSASSGSPQAVRDQRRSLELDEHRGNLLRLRLGLTVGAPIWICFGVLDWVVARFGEGPSLAWLWSIRFSLAPVMLIALWLLWRSPPPSPRLLRAIDVGLYALAGHAIVVMAVDCGGIASRYPTGVMMILVARAAFVAQDWRRGLLPNLLIASSYPSVMAIAALLRDPVAAQLSDPAALTAGLHHLFFIVGTAILTLAGSHFAWAVRRRLYEMRSIGRYELKRKLGSGGMGEVWAAYHGSLKRTVAVKVLRADAAPVEAARFEREIKATSELTHPNTIRVYDYGVTEDGVWYYAMELLEGSNLARLISEEGALAPERAAYLVSQAARSLAEAHRRGIVHRDVKPANIFVTTAGGEADFVKVLDFGIAKAERDTDGLTRVGEVAGTPRYMAPEVLMTGRATARSDVYGLGAVLYTLLAGRAPFEGDQAAAVYLAQLTEVPEPPSAKRGATLPEGLERIVLRCLEREPERRYADAAELADALAPFASAWRPLAGRTARSERPTDEMPALVTTPPVAPR